MSKRFVYVLLLAALALLVGIQVSAQDGMTVLRFPITSDPASLEPGLVKELFAGQLALNLHAGLFTYDASNNVVPYIVKDYTVSDDGLVYTFNLRDDVLWQNGRPLVAADFKKGWERYLDPNVGAQTAGEPWADVVGGPELYAGEIDELTGVKALDDYTLEVTLVRPSLSFLQTLAVPVTWVVPEEAVVAGQPEWVGDPVGAGPFRFVEWIPNVKIVLEANSDFFLGKPAVDRIEFLVVPDASTALAQYEAGELDIVGVPASDLERITNDATLGAQLQYFTRAQLQYAGMNQSMFEPFKDVRVRQAFNYAIDKETIVSAILNNSWTVATGLVPPHIPEYNSDLQGYAYDPAKAQELMSEAGFPNGEGFPTLELATLNSTIGEAVAAMLNANLGITVEILQPERGDMIDGLWAHDRWQFFLFGWTADSPSAGVWTYELMYCGLDSNFSTYCNPDVDLLVDQARDATTFDESKQAWQDAEVLAVADAAMIPLGYSRFIYLVNPAVEGFQANLFGPMGFDTVSFNS
ncbi:MAG: ABC transporter substrate-binding protein [Anaerolineaceae bacterium]|nr:ABC transporter substrate-binding protein [Anaerolineaceae bacterium]